MLHSGPFGGYGPGDEMAALSAAFRHRATEAEAEKRRKAAERAALGAALGSGAGAALGAGLTGGNPLGVAAGSTIGGGLGGQVASGRYDAAEFATGASAGIAPALFLHFLRRGRVA